MVGHVAFVPIINGVREAFDTGLGKLDKDRIEEVVNRCIRFCLLKVLKLVLDEVDVRFYVAFVIGSKGTGFDDVFDAFVERVFARMDVITGKP